MCATDDLYQLPATGVAKFDLLSNDVTNGPEPEHHDVSKAYVSTPAGLVDRYLSAFDRRSIPFVLLLLTIAALAGIDDWRGKLDSGPALIHFLWKIVTVGGAFAGVGVLYGLYRGTCWLWDFAQQKLR